MLNKRGLSLSAKLGRLVHKDKTGRYVITAEEFQKLQTSQNFLTPKHTVLIVTLLLIVTVPLVMNFSY